MAIDYNPPMLLEAYNFGAAPIRKEPNDERILYHFTNFAAAQSIIENKQLWASDIRFLNDNKEFQYCFELVIENLRMKLHTEVNEDKNFVYKSIVHRLEHMKNVSSFIVSFSEVGDQLSQWRGYGSSGPISIGFDFNKLYPAAQSKSFRLIPCIYKIDEQLAIIEELIDKIYNEFMRNKGSDLFSEKKANLGEQHFYNLIYSNFLLIGTIFKHPSFIEEREWRLIGTGLTNWAKVKFKPSINSLLKYYEFDLDFDNEFLGIKKFYIGPNRDQNLAIDVFRSYVFKTLTHMKSTEWQIKLSNSSYIPY